MPAQLRFDPRGLAAYFSDLRVNLSPPVMLAVVVGIAYGIYASSKMSGGFRLVVTLLSACTAFAWAQAWAVAAGFQFNSNATRWFIIGGVALALLAAISYFGEPRD